MALIFPSNLDEIGGGHRIQFYVLQNTPVQYGEMFKNAFNNFSFPSTEQNTNTAFDIAEKFNSGASFFSGSTKSFNIHKDSSKLIETISLYMPDTINTTQNANWHDISLTEEFGLLGLIGQTGKTAYEEYKKGGLNNIVNTISGNDNLIAPAIEATGMFLSNAGLVGKDIGAYGLNIGGMAINPQLEMLFHGIGLRSFQYEFIFTPKNEKESNEAKEIIKTFRKYSAPSIVSGSSAGRYFNVPNKFEIEYQYKGSENQFLHKIAPSVLETVNVDYATRGWAAFENGAPLQIRMILQFKEIVIIDQSKIDEGY